MSPCRRIRNIYTHLRRHFHVLIIMKHGKNDWFHEILNNFKFVAIYFHDKVVNLKQPLLLTQTHTWIGITIHAIVPLI
jgi:hypothetical protein